MWGWPYFPVIPQSLIQLIPLLHSLFSYFIISRVYEYIHTSSPIGNGTISRPYQSTYSMLLLLTGIEWTQIEPVDQFRLIQNSSFAPSTYLCKAGERLYQK